MSENRIPDPLTVMLIPILRLVIPDPGAVSTDPTPFFCCWSLIPYTMLRPWANVNIMMRFRVIKLVGIFSLVVTAVFLYTFNKFVPSTSSYFTKLFQERSTKENHLSTRNQIQLIQANEQLIIFITSAPFYTSRRLSIRQTWLSLLVSNSVARGRSNIRTLMKNSSNSSSNLVIHYWFVCGHDTKVDVESAVRNESAVYGDILRLNYTESYSLLAFKTMSSLWLASVMDVQFTGAPNEDIVQNHLT